MSGTFLVQNGHTIRAIAGDFGKNATLEGAGGGGASGAVDCGSNGPSGCANGTIMIVAAGGGGGDEFPGLGGSSNVGSGEGGAKGGNPDHPSDWGGGGGGENSDGDGFPPPSTNGGEGGKKISLTGLAAGGAGSGNQVPNNGGSGMGGGGGGGDYGAGGGGGHTGGDGGNGAPAGSFNSGDEQANADGTDGYVFPAGSPPAGISGTVTVICLAALPVELVNFVALLPKNGGVQLLWETASEKNNRGFDVERSADGRSWTSLDFVSGHGTTALPHKYSFFDEHPLEGVNYYRLKQWDTDGRFEFTPIVIADVRANSQHFDVFPNPSADGNITFRLVSRQEGNGLLEIYDWAGYKVYKEALQLPEGTLAWPVDLATFPRGTYTSRLELADGTVLFQKIVLH